MYNLDKYKKKNYITPTSHLTPQIIFQSPYFNLAVEAGYREGSPSSWTLIVVSQLYPSEKFSFDKFNAYDNDNTAVKFQTGKYFLRFSNGNSMQRIAVT